MPENYYQEYEEEKYYIREIELECGTNEGLIEVIPETIGQFTGLYDKNGKEIYEGDILKDRWNTIYVVKYKNSGFYIYRNNGRNGYSKIASWNGTKEVIGNTTDNKNLLEGE